MSQQLNAVILRLALIQGSRDKLINKLNGKAPAIPRGNAVDVQCAMFVRDPQASTLVDDLSNLSAVTMQVRKTDALGEALFDKTVAIADFDNAGLPFADWNNDTDQQLTFKLTADETGQNLAGKSELSIYIAFQGVPVEGDPFFLGSIQTVIFEPGIGNAGAPTPGNPNYLTAAQSDARYARRGVSVPDYRSELSAYTGGGADALDGLDITGFAAGYLLTFDHADDGLKNYILRAGEAAEASPGVIVPDVQPDEDSPMYWESR